MVTEITKKINGKLITVNLEANGVSIAIEGYGMKVAKSGSVVYVDISREEVVHPHVYVWSDIESEDAEFVIDLGGTAEDKPPIPDNKKLTTKMVIGPTRKDYWFLADLATKWKEYLDPPIPYTNQAIHESFTRDGVLDDLEWKKDLKRSCLNYYFAEKRHVEIFLDRANKWLEKHRV